MLHESLLYRKILVLNTIFTIIPYMLGFFLILPIMPDEIGHHNGIKTFVDSTAEMGFYGFMVQFSMKSWLFTFPLWIICSIFCLTQKNSTHQFIKVMFTIGLIGHLIAIYKLLYPSFL